MPLLAEALGRDYRDECKSWRDSPVPEAAIGEARLAGAGGDTVRKLMVAELSRS